MSKCVDLRPTQQWPYVLSCKRPGYLVVLFALTSLVVSCALPLTTARPVEQEVVIGTQIIHAEIVPSNGQSTLSENQAVALASTQVPTAATASAIDGQLVTLTLRDANGAVAMGIAQHPVWLVLFHGVSYDPLSGLESTCPCGESYKRSNTAVALDSHSGAVVIIYGVS